MSELLEYKCPCCGGAVEFDSSTQRMKCPYCDTEFETEAMMQDQEELNNPPADSTDWSKDDEAHWDAENDGMAVYVCESCGGEIICEETTGATRCPFCDNPVVMKKQFSGDLRPDLIIPFKIDSDAAVEALKKHMSGKKFIPKIFKDENHIKEIKGIYVPEWLFNCEAKANVTFHGEQMNTWSDMDFSYTEKNVYRIRREGTVTISDLPVDGSKKMDDTLMESIEPFDVSEAVEFSTVYLSGYLADRYDVSADESIERANERIKKSAMDEMRSTVDDNFMNVSAETANINVDSGSYRYALYPVWLLNTKWNDQNFVFAVNGQTGKIVGDLPTDKGAFWKWVGIATAAIGSALFGLTWLLGLM